MSGTAVHFRLFADRDRRWFRKWPVKSQSLARIVCVVRRALKLMSLNRQAICAALLFPHHGQRPYTVTNNRSDEAGGGC